MPVMKPTSLTWTCLECNYKIENQPSKEAYKQKAFDHQKENHLLTEDERDFFMAKFLGFYRIE